MSRCLLLCLLLTACYEPAPELASTTEAYHVSYPRLITAEPALEADVREQVAFWNASLGVELLRYVEAAGPGVAVAYVNDAREWGATTAEDSIEFAPGWTAGTVAHECGHYLLAQHDFATGESCMGFHRGTQCEVTAKTRDEIMAAYVRHTEDAR